ncbi:nuclear pore protein 84 / 107 [Nitzschia inconspicua]|uniref:Nuclear pore complex protein n=1 Tax=Nitzschia inconspicua TaxID=303405 RepID=A0A9K3LWF3_9STRA|nr:nuclear pore protein 84 / 107 [Nitzschia inconspicua]
MPTQQQQQQQSGESVLHVQELAERALAAVDAEMALLDSNPDGESLQAEDTNSNNTMMTFYEELVKGPGPAKVVPSDKVMGDRDNNTTTPKHTPVLLQRSPTPIMSNSSSSLKNMYQQYTPNDYDGYDDYDTNNVDTAMAMDTEPAPVETPMLQRNSPFYNQQQQQNAPQTTTARMFANAAMAIPSVVPGSPSLNEDSFKQYYNSLLDYLHLQRRINRQQQLVKAEDRLTGTLTDTTTTTTTASLSTGLVPPLSDQNTQAQVAFFKDLASHCYHMATKDSKLIEEGHMWNLLAHLRSLGMDALLWADDSSSTVQNETFVDMELRRITNQVDATSKEIYDALSSSKCMPLRRIQRLVDWAQSCVGRESKSIKEKLPQPTSWTTPPVDLTRIDTPQNTDPRIKILMQVCLHEILQGNVKEACRLAQAHGCGHMTIAWEGGQPHGYEINADHKAQLVRKKEIGNERRFLWKYMNGTTGRQSLERSKGLQQNSNSTLLEDSAMRTILTNDFQSSLQNPVINRSWTKSICVILKGGWERVVDEALHRHNTNRRRRPGPAYPGTQFEKQELALLEMSKELAGMKGSQITALLASTTAATSSKQSDFDERDVFSYKSSIMAFIVGKSALYNLCTNYCSKFLQTFKQDFLGRDTGDDDQAIQLLRFMTHLLLYLDSIDLPVNDLTVQKNAVLFQYVTYLNSRSDLRDMLALYVSFLPDVTILEFYPTILAHISNLAERKQVLDQIHDLMPTLMLPLLRKVVRILLGTTTSLQYGNDLDHIKCNSIQWLLQRDEHFGDALICSNIYMRQLLLDDDDDKIDVAMDFLDSYLPSDLVLQVQDLQEHNPVIANEAGYLDRVKSATVEHQAFGDYLDAYRAFGDFKDTLDDALSNITRNVAADLSNLHLGDSNSNSKSHPLSQRDWVRQMKELVANVADAAGKARVALYKVLAHPGGWLSLDPTTDTDKSSSGASEEQRRQQDLEKIRARHLVVAVGLYHQVCQDAAMFMSRVLDNAGTFGLDRNEVLPMLDYEVSKGLEESKSTVAPSYWYNHAKNLINIVANDAYGIHTVFPHWELTELLRKIADMVAEELLNNP